MAKSPENMTAEERLKRIRSLERKVRDLERDKDWAERDQQSTNRWAEKAWEEVRHLRDMCTLHWNEKQEIRRAAGLEPQPSYVPLAKWNRETKEWDPVEVSPTDLPDSDYDGRCGWCRKPLIDQLTCTDEPCGLRAAPASTSQVQP